MFERIMITGAAGFIGFHLSKALLDAGRNVFGYDNLNDYYDVDLKKARLRILESYPRFQFKQADLADAAALDGVYTAFKPQVVVNLAAQAGVRYSIDHPRAYTHSNIDGFINILESCRQHGTAHLVYASSSSVYGANTNMPFSVHHNVDHPVSLYAATKKANELMAHTYAHLYGLPCTGLRFFTVYGPWGRPDMAYYKFTRSLYEGQMIDVYNQGRMKRDLTYIDDVVEAVGRLLDCPAKPDPDWTTDAPDPATSAAPYRIYNVGNNKPVALMDMIRGIEQATGMKAQLNMLPMQPGEVPETYADIDALQQAVDFKPSTPFNVGIDRFVRWYRDYYALGNGP